MKLDMISRRRFLKSAGAAALAVTAASVLAGCSSGSSSSNGGSGNVTPAPVPGATEDITIIFFDEDDLDPDTQQPVQVGTGVLKNVLKTADHVNTSDIPEDQFPADYYYIAESRDLEIREKDGKKYVYVFLRSRVDLSKKVTVALKDMTDPTSPVDMETTATINKDATTVMPKEIELPEGYEFYPNYYDMDYGYPLSVVFVVVKKNA